MKIIEVTNEMTMRGPSFDAAAEKFGQLYASSWLANGTHIGDIEHYQLVKYCNYYSLWDNQKLVAFTSLTDDTNEVDDVWVDEKYRSHKIFSKLLWFYKTRLQRNKLILGPVHSKTMQEVTKGLSRFKKSWINTATNTAAVYDINTLDDYYSYGGPTEWRLMLENDSTFTNWPMYTRGQSYVKENYSEYIN